MGLATLKRIEKIVGENAFDEKKKRPRLKFNPGLALISLQTTGPRILGLFSNTRDLHGSKFEFRYESLKSKFSLILFVNNLGLATLKRIEKIVGENAFDEKKKRPRLKFNPGLALISLQTTGPRILGLFSNTRDLHG